MEKCVICFFVLSLLCSCGSRQIDERYVARLVKTKLALSEDVVVEPLKGGFSGTRLFIATVGSQKYVVRFLNQKSQLDHSHEFDALQVASDHGYGPHIYFADRDAGVVIMEFLQVQPIVPELWQSGKVYALLAEFLQKVHRGPLFADRENYSVFSSIGTQLRELELLCKGSLTIEHLLKVVSDLEGILHNHLTQTSCHNDLHYRNLIFVGDKFKAVDYEVAAPGDPYFDLAMVTISFCENTSHEHVLLSSYLGRQPTKKELTKLYFMKQVAWIYTAVAFLKMTPALCLRYNDIDVPSYEQFISDVGFGRISLDEQIGQIKFAKTRINKVFENYQSEAFRDAKAVLN